MSLRLPGPSISSKRAARLVSPSATPCTSLPRASRPGNDDPRADVAGPRSACGCRRGLRGAGGGSTPSPSQRRGTRRGRASGGLRHGPCMQRAWRHTPPDPIPLSSADHPSARTPTSHPPLITALTHHGPHAWPFNRTRARTQEDKAAVEARKRLAVEAYVGGGLTLPPCPSTPSYSNTQLNPAQAVAVVAPAYPAGGEGWENPSYHWRPTRGWE
jgi:hypothetical protein